MNLFRYLFVRSEQLPQAFGHRTLALSREIRLDSGRPFLLEQFLRLSRLQNRSNQSGPPLAKTCVSVSSPGLHWGSTPTATPCGNSDSLRSSDVAATRVLSSLRDQSPRYRSWQSASLTPTRVRAEGSPGLSPPRLQDVGRLWRPRFFGEYWKMACVLVC